MNGINLIPAHRLAARRRAARLRLWVYIAPACVTALASSYGYFLATWQTSTADVQERLDALDARIASAQQETNATKAALRDAQAALLAARIIGEQPDWGLVLSFLASRLGDDAVLSAFQLEPAAASSGSEPAKSAPPSTGRPMRYRLTLSGLTRTQEAVSRLAVDLGNIHLFDAVTLAESRRSTFHNTEAVSFRIECAITDAPGVSLP